EREMLGERELRPWEVVLKVIELTRGGQRDRLRRGGTTAANLQLVGGLAAAIEAARPPGAHRTFGTDHLGRDVVLEAGQRERDERVAPAREAQGAGDRLAAGRIVVA